MGIPSGGSIHFKTGRRRNCGRVDLEEGNDWTVKKKNKSKKKKPNKTNNRLFYVGWVWSSRVSEQRLEAPLWSFRRIDL